MKEKAKDKRYFPRVTVLMAGSVTANDNPIAIQTMDLTVEGISFKIQKNLQEGTNINIDLYGNEKLDSNRLKAQVLRCDPVENTSPTQYGIAAKFIDVNDRYLMDSLALVYGKPRKK